MIVAEKWTLKIGLCKGRSSIESRLVQYLVHVPIIRALCVVLVPVNIKKADVAFKTSHRDKRITSLTGNLTEWLAFGWLANLTRAINDYETATGMPENELWTKIDTHRLHV